MGPIFPYVDIPPLHIAGPFSFEMARHLVTVPELSIKPFGTLVAIGVFIGTETIRRHGKVLGVDEKELASFVFTLLMAGFIGGHVFDTLWYHPDELARSPWSLLRIWDGQSSFGGFTGAFLGLVYWKLRHRRPTLQLADATASGFPVGWVFGRMGCSVAHDHPGLRSESWLAVRYPGGGRFDLGLYEMLLTIPLALAFLWLARKPRPRGFYLGVMCMAYAPSRFALDFLRAREGELAGADPRYGGLTPAQWACFLLLAVGCHFAYRAARSTELGGDAPRGAKADDATPAAASTNSADA